MDGAQDGLTDYPAECLSFTAGKAVIVPKELFSSIRSHKDLAKDAAPLWRSALKFYEHLAVQLVANGHSVDVFACALEQSGLAEMKPMVQSTGGLVVQTDTFRNPVFKDSLTRVFASEGTEGFLGTCSCATLDVHCSRDVKLQVRAWVVFSPVLCTRQ